MGDSLTESVVVKELRDCPRCEGDHLDLVFDRLLRPMRDEADKLLYNYWTLCPETLEPIMNLITETTP